MDGRANLKLLSFVKRQKISNYEPKVTRFTGQLCLFCNTLCLDKTSFEEHQLACVGDDNVQQNIEVEETSSQEAEDTLCTMPSLSEIEEVHDQIEIDRKRERRIKCEMCPERFYSVRACRDHLKLTHLGDGMAEAFKNQGKLCNVCGKTFQSRKFAEEHMRIHTGEKPYVCSHCGKRFRLEILLKSHERVHTGEKPYKCELCHWAFASQSNLDRHQMVHTGLRRFECMYCHKAFGQKVTLQQHVQTVHFKQPWKYTGRYRLQRKMRKDALRLQKIKKEQEQYEHNDASDSN